MMQSQSAPSVPKLIDVRALTKRYGSRTVVDTVSLYMVVGLVRPNGGEVLLTDGAGATTDITHQPIHVRAREGIGYLAQETSVFRRLSVADNLRLIWEQRDVTPEEQERRLPLLLQEFGLELLAGSSAETLSGGERRRVEIARAIATDPSFLLLDEPFTGIDPIAVADIQEIIRLLRAKGLGVLITDHAVRETLAIVDRAYILNRGHIEVSGTAAEVAESPVARQFYLGESFRL